MDEGTIFERIAAWEAAGLIDPETAARLRASEAERPEPSAQRPSVARSTLGPTPTVAEVLGYIGGAFLLAAWFVLMGARAPGSDSSGTWTMAFAVAALVTVGLGLLLRDRSERSSRAAGVLFAATAVMAYGVGFNLVEVPTDQEWSLQFLAGGLAALAVAAGLRVRHPALLTHGAFLGSVLALAGGIAAFVKESLLPVGSVETLAGVGLDLAVWLAAAVALGIIALGDRSTGDEARMRRSTLSRFAAGMTAVIATAAILTRSGPADTEYGWGRLLEPIVAEVAIAGVALVLLGLAFRRSAPAYLYPSALGIILALSDLNGSYVADQTGVAFALMLEGVVILGAGFAADRLRRRVGVARAPGA